MVLTAAAVLLTCLAKNTLNSASDCVITTEDYRALLTPCSQLGADYSPVRLPSSAPAKDATWQVGIDDSKHLQQILGFGAAWTDAAVTVLRSLNETALASVIVDLFDEDGIGLTLMRHTIGQSDLTPGSVGKYSYDENGDKPDDNELSHFSLTSPGENMVAIMKDMLYINPNITVLGSIWSPPTWMKGGSNNNQVQDDMADRWVRYFVEYLTEFRAQGVKVDAITVQNEPLHSYTPSWTTYMTSKQQATLITALSEALEATPGISDTEIWTYDHNTDKPDYPRYVLDNTRPGVVDAVAWHCYAGIKDKWKVLLDFAQQYAGVKQIMTECWLHLNSGEGFFDLPDFVSQPVKHGASGSLAWTVAGSVNYDVALPGKGTCTQCSGLIQVDMVHGVAYKTQDYYTMGHFSHYVKNGDHYLATASGDYIYPDGTGVDTTAFVTKDGGKVAVIQNKVHSDLHLQLTFPHANESYIGVVPARSVVTWRFD